MPITMHIKELPTAEGRVARRESMRESRAAFKERMTELLSEGFTDPIEVLACIAGNLVRNPVTGFPEPREKEYDPKARVIAAAELCSYLYPKLKSIEVTGDKNKPISFAVVTDTSPVPELGADGTIINAELVNQHSNQLAGPVIQAEAEED